MALHITFSIPVEYKFNDICAHIIAEAFDTYFYPFPKPLQKLHFVNLCHSGKVAACNHICHIHLNVALACLYCSSKENPKMRWYSASAWESHVCKHTQDDLPIFLDDLAYACLPLEAIPSTGLNESALAKEILCDVTWIYVTAIGIGLWKLTKQFMQGHMGGKSGASADVQVSQYDSTAYAWGLFPPKQKDRWSWYHYQDITVALLM